MRSSGSYKTCISPSNVGSALIQQLNPLGKTHNESKEWASEPHIHGLRVLNSLR